MRVTVHPALAVSKPDPSRDYQLERLGTAPEGLGNEVRRWLAAFPDQQQALAAVQRLEGENWLTVVVALDGTDYSGRPLSMAWAGQVQPDLDPARWLDLAVAALTELTPLELVERSFELAEASAEEESWGQLVQLVASADARVGTDSLRRARWLLRRAPWTDWLVVCNSLRREYLPKGVGLALADQSTPVEATLEDLARHLPRNLDLEELHQLGLEPRERLRLLEALRSRGLLEGLDLPRIRWLRRNSGSPTAILGRLDTTGLAELARAGELDIEHLTPALEDRAPDQVSQVLGAMGRGMEIARLARTRGLTSKEVEAAMPETLLQAEAGWRHGGEPPAPEELRALAELGRADRWPAFGLREILAQGGALAELAREERQRRWRAAGATDQVLGILLDERPRASAGDPPPAALRPIPEELLPTLAPDRLDALLAEIPESGPWIRWWLDLVPARHEPPVLLPDTGALRRCFSIYTRSTIEGDRFVAASVAAGWRPGGADWSWLRRLRLETAPDLVGTEGLPLVSAGHPPLGRLLRAGLVQVEEALRWAVSRRKPSLLAEAGVEAEWIALLDTEVSPPERPPAQDRPELTVWLEDACQDLRFWSRWQGGLTAEMAAFLRDRTAAGKSAGLGRRVAETFSGGTLDLVEVGQVAGALPEGVLVGMVVEAARLGDRALVDFLLEQGRLRPPVRAHVRSFLLGEALALSSTPDADLRLSLIAFLHPVQQVLLPMLWSAAALPAPTDPRWAGLLRKLEAADLVPLAPPKGAWQRQPWLMQQVVEIPQWSAWSGTGEDR